MLMMFDKAWSRANEYADENGKAHYKTEVWERPEEGSGAFMHSLRVGVHPNWKLPLGCRRLVPHGFVAPAAAP